MRVLFSDYVKLRKTGLVRNGNILLILMLIPSVIGLIIENCTNFAFFNAAYSFVISIDFFCALLVPLIMANRYSSGKYLFYCTLPIKSINLIEYLYFETYRVIIVGFLITSIINSIQYGLSYTVIHCFKLVLALCLSNLFIPMLSSGEFKKPNESQMTEIVAIIVSILLISAFTSIIALITGFKLIDSYLNNVICKIVTLSLSFILVLIIVMTFKKSYFHTAKKVRLMP